MPELDLSALAIRRVLYPLWAWKNGSARLRYLAQLERSQYWSPEHLREYQWSALKKLVVYAFENCPYYTSKYRSAGISPADLRTPDDLSIVPTITKEEIQEHRDELISKRFNKDRLIPDMTGGSTGSPLQFYYDHDRLDSRAAATLRHNRWAGWEIGDRAAILWGAPRDTKTSGKMRDRVRGWVLERRIILDASSLDEAVMSEFARKLVKYRPKVLLAYANTLALFARYLEDEKIATITPRGIVCSAEVLTEENRNLIERVFGSRVYNRYGSREFAVIASECQAHAGMHVNAENLCVEVLVKGMPSVGQTGEIVVTDIKNYAMPMIRYRTKDIGLLKPEACSCARGLPLLDLSGGRETDFLLATTGKKVSGIVVATYVITNIPGVRQVQFVQDAPDAVTVNLVKGPGWSEAAEGQLIGKLREFLGAEIKTRTVFRDHIPLAPSGKYRFSISNLKGGAHAG
jgi:phenylacetate-CoA ligase